MFIMLFMDVVFVVLVTNSSLSMMILEWLSRVVMNQTIVGLIMNRVFLMMSLNEIHCIKFMNALLFVMVRNWTHALVFMNKTLVTMIVIWMLVMMFLDTGFFVMVILEKFSPTKTLFGSMDEVFAKMVSMGVSQASKMTMTLIICRMGCLWES
jgi:hypothetical protein